MLTGTTSLLPADFQISLEFCLSLHETVFSSDLIHDREFFYSSFWPLVFLNGVSKALRDNFSPKKGIKPTSSKFELYHQPRALIPHKGLFSGGGL
jgi:hypothetical protein